jgi:hypothetical protein
MGSTAASKGSRRFITRRSKGETATNRKRPRYSII